MGKIKIFLTASISILTACKSSEHKANQSDEAGKGGVIHHISSDKPPKGIARCTGSFIEGDNKYTLTLSFGLVPKMSTAPWPTSSAPAVELTSSSTENSESVKKISSRLQLDPGSNSNEANRFLDRGVPTRKHKFNIEPSNDLAGDCDLLTRGSRFVGKDSQGVVKELDSYSTEAKCRLMLVDKLMISNLVCDPFTATPESLKLKDVRIIGFE